MKVIASVLLLAFTVACSSEDPPAQDATPAPGVIATETPLATPTEDPSDIEEPEPFVSAFMQARLDGDADRANIFLSPDAEQAYSSGEGGLTLIPPAPVTWTRFLIEESAQADAGSWEMQVRVFEDDGEGGEGSFVETLFVGPGPDASGAQRSLVIRGAIRSEG